MQQKNYNVHISASEMKEFNLAVIWVFKMLRGFVEECLSKGFDDSSVQILWRRKTGNTYSQTVIFYQKSAQAGMAQPEMHEVLHTLSFEVPEGEPHMDCIEWAMSEIMKLVAVSGLPLKAKFYGNALSTSSDGKSYMGTFIYEPQGPTPPAFKSDFSG